MDTAIVSIIIIGAAYYVFTKVRGQFKNKGGCGCGSGCSCGSSSGSCYQESGDQGSCDK